MPVTILTDSASDLPRDIAEKNGIRVLPLLVFLGEQEFRDGETMNPKDMFDGMREGKVYKTAQVPLHEFRKTFQELAEKKEPCLYVAFSSELSGTYQSAVLARNEVLEDYPDFQLEILDTKCASLGFGLVVLRAAELARQGLPMEELVSEVSRHASHMEHIFTVDNLEYLQRGGRVSRAAAFIGGLLNIKPVLHVESGRLVPLEKIRGRRKVFERMAAIMGERGDHVKEQLIGISHGDDLEAVETLKALLRERFGCESFLVSQIGGVVGAHAGPGTLALFFLNRM
ncbi:DegV family protein [Gorillibacterium sp. sgz5001074]|uniref:DegV family protein n=1 Tax=Gorillibacterium sp. sgz5001074 TaxID=3446695 RepID=UPI003F6627DA